MNDEEEQTSGSLGDQVGSPRTGEEEKDEVLEPEVPRIEALVVKNYRGAGDLQLRPLSPLTVLLGPNGSGKSTVFDVFTSCPSAFRSGCARPGTGARASRSCARGGRRAPSSLKSNMEGSREAPLITYHLTIDEGYGDRGRRVAPLAPRAAGPPFGSSTSGRGRPSSAARCPDDQDQRIDEELDSPEMLAVRTLGQFARYPRVSALRRFITGWYLSLTWSADSPLGTRRWSAGALVGELAQSAQKDPVSLGRHPERWSRSWTRSPAGTTPGEGGVDGYGRRSAIVAD